MPPARSIAGRSRRNAGPPYSRALPSYVDPAARAAFKTAIEEIERASQAEIVVSVRRQSARWAHANVLAGALGAIAAHAYMLYADHAFSTDALFFDPILAGIVVGLASTLVLGLRRWLTPASWRRAAVTQAARATFVDRGIRRTRAGSGVLVYVSLVEQMAEVVADDGVLANVKDDAWRMACTRIDRAVARGADAVAKEIIDLRPLLATALPPREDDVNELPDDLDGDLA